MDKATANLANHLKENCDRCFQILQPLLEVNLQEIIYPSSAFSAPPASIKRGGNEYEQYWYHWEIWREGDRVTKKSKYIPKTKQARVEKMNNEKVPVEEILKVLRNRSKRKK